MSIRNHVSDSYITGCIPILVGISGHIDIENEQELTKHVKEILLALCQKYKSSPIVVLTPLAEGADRAAAKAVIELRELNITKVSYVVMLPMDECEYKGTFLNQESISEYEFLKSKAEGCYRVPFADSLDLDRLQVKEERYSKLYANMDAYLALNTQVLIAAWNGAEEALKNSCKNDNVELGISQCCMSDGAICPNFEINQGGTYHVLRMRFFGVEDEYKGSESFLSNREFGPVYWVKTKRKSSEYLAEGIIVDGPAYPDYPIDYSTFDLENSNDDTNKKCRKLVMNYFQNRRNLKSNKNGENRTYEDILSKLNGYNSDVVEMYPVLAEKIKISRNDFITFSDEGNTQMKEVASFNEQENNFIDRYAVADALSFDYQNKRKRDVKFLVALAFGGLLSFNLYSGPLPSNWFILLYSFIYLFGSLYYLFKIKHNKYHEKYVDYRGIAEGLRIQFFWYLTGIKNRVTDKYLTKQKSSIDWIRISINNVLFLLKSNDQQNNNNSKHKEKIYSTYKLWLLNQYEYYNRKWPDKDRTERIQKRIEKILFILGLTLAVVLAGLDTYEFITTGTCGVSKMFLPFNSNSDYEGIHKWIVFSVGFLPVIIASYKVFTELLAYSKLSRSYKWMHMVYNIALHEFKRIKNNHESDEEVFIRKSRKLFYDVGIEALLENGEWIGIFEERAPEMPK